MPYPTYIFSYAIVITSLTVTCSVLRLITRLICASRNAVKFSFPGGWFNSGRGRCHRVFHRVERDYTISRFLATVVWKYIRGRETFSQLPSSTTVGRFIFDLRHCWKAVVEREESGIEGLRVEQGHSRFRFLPLMQASAMVSTMIFYDFVSEQSYRNRRERFSKLARLLLRVIIRGLLDSFSFFFPFWGGGRIDDCNCTIFHF